MERVTAKTALTASAANDMNHQTTHLCFGPQQRTNILWTVELAILPQYPWFDHG